MKKILSILTIVALAIGIMACNRDNDVSVTGVSLNETAVTLIVGEHTTLVATVTPSGATNPAVTWVSNYPAIASVENGVVTAVAEGTAIITVTTQDGNHTATAEITVSADVINVTGVSLNETAVALYEGENVTLVATVTPSDATNPAVTWGTSDATVATVDNGVVTAVAGGTATITVTTEDGNHEATAEIAVNVATVYVTGVSVRSHAKIIHSEGITLVATVYPSYATNQDLIWTTSDETVATVDANGVVTTVGGGSTAAFSEIRTVEITVTTECGDFSATTVISALPDRGCPRPGAAAFPETFVLGTPTFVSNQTWTVPGTDQVWSDAVRAPFCDKDTYQGAMPGIGGAQRVDCRRSVNDAFEGHFFSWCMVMRYANELCPYPWRVPSRADFVILRDNMLGGAEALIGTVGTVAEPTPRGGEWGGTRFTGGFNNSGGAVAGETTFYWSVTEQTGTLTFRLYINAAGVNPDATANRFHGHAVRCVKNQ